MNESKLRKAAKDNYTQALLIVTGYLDAVVEANKQKRMPRARRAEIIQLQMNLLHDRSAIMEQMRQM